MKIIPANFATRMARSASRRALSLIEIMVTVALLAVIILGLVAMFDQTRKAFTSGLNQGDYMEAGRSAMDMIVRELEQMTPAYQPNVENFYADVSPNYSPLLQPLTEPLDVRTNTMEMLYFLTRSNQQWTATGYKVDPFAVTNQIGTLYRYNVALTNQPVSLTSKFSSDTNLAVNYNRVADGVVSFRIRAFDDRGRVLTRVRNDNILAIANRGEYFYRFNRDSVPAYVEVELAILEERTFERYRSLTNSQNNANAASFLAGHAGQVHVFRQRVPIRCVDPRTDFTDSP